MNVRPNVLKKNVALADRLAGRNGGNLPNPWKLIQSGHAALYRYILRHPEYFEHIEYDPVVEDHRSAKINISIRDQHLKMAGQLKASEGRMPSMRWLSDNGHSKLVSYMRLHPEMFNGKSGIINNATISKSSSAKRKRTSKTSSSK